MRLLSDEKLGEALWMRSKAFSGQGDFYNAILDLGAAHRLLSLSHDERAEEVRLDWEKNYQQLVSVEQNTTNEQKKTENALSELIQRVQERKRGGPTSAT